MGDLICSGSNLYRQRGNCKTNAYVGETLNPIPDKILLSKYVLLRQLLSTEHIESILSYVGITYCTPDQR